MGFERYDDVLLNPEVGGAIRARQLGDVLLTPNLQSQPALTYRREVRTAGNKAHVDARSGQLHAKVAPNRAGAENAYPGSIV